MESVGLFFGGGGAVGKGLTFVSQVRWQPGSPRSAGVIPRAPRLVLQTSDKGPPPKAKGQQREKGLLGINNWL